MENRKIIVFITASSEEEAEKIARNLVEKRLSACCNIVPGLRSIYRWKGKICDDKEVLIIIKTMQNVFKKLIEEVRKIHSYTVPEIISFKIEDGFKEYLDWIEKEVKTQVNPRNIMGRTALIVVDMLNDFVNEKGALYCGKSSREIIPFIVEEINRVREIKGLIIFLQDNHNKNDPEFRMFPEHCVAGTWGAQIIDEIEVKPEDVIIPKKRYSGFYGTELDKILKENNITDVKIVGVCTSICVMDTVGDLRNRDYPVTVFKKGVADFDPEAHKFSLKRMQKIYGAKII